MSCIFFGLASAAQEQTRLVLDGGRGNFPAATCVSTSATHTQGTSIVSQCCDPSDTSNEGCRRYVGTDDDAGCVGGRSPPRPYTFAQAQALCDGLGLVMCDRRCVGTGCAYNQYPLWSILECPSPTVSPTSQPTAAPTGYPTAMPTDNLACDALCSLGGPAQTCEFWQAAHVTCSTLASFPGPCADRCA